MTTNTILANLNSIAPAQQKVVRILADKHADYITFCDQLRSHVGEKNYQKLLAANS